MLAVSDLDVDNVVDIDFGSSAFKQNARAILAQWARRPPFYVLSSGPPQAVCGRYADVHEVFSDTERFSSQLPRGRGFEQFDKFMGVQFITQMDGEQHGPLFCSQGRSAAFRSLGVRDDGHDIPRSWAGLSSTRSVWSRNIPILLQPSNVYTISYWSQ